jgi:hypothetical protein
MDWISIADNGLPKPDNTKEYFVLYPDGIGYGTFNFDFEWNPSTKKYIKAKKKTRWYLDFDAAGNEEKVTHYMEIEYPKEYWDE